VTTLRGRNALVTGSTSGIGLGIARALAKEGVNVMLHGLAPPAELARLRDELAAETGTTIGVEGGDLRRPAEAAALVQTTQRTLGSLDILVNNAGVQFVSPVEEFPPERWEEIRAIVLDASFHAIRAALPGMRSGGWGRIINVVSAHGLVASPFKSAYVSAKHGLVGLTKTVALEVAENGITCNAICPGYVRTPLVEAQIADQARVHQLAPERVIRDVLLAAQPTKRFVEIEEVAGLAVFLCGENARSITGAAIAIGGGWTAR
jgi:3-hydroxybutyrate dehydrogenase